MTLRYPLSILTILLLAVTTRAADPGSAGFSFLKISPGARNAAMGDVGVSVASGVYAPFFNPASLRGTVQPAIGFMHQEYIFDTRREFVGGASPLLGGVGALGFDYFKIGNLKARLGPTELPLGEFDAQDMLLTGSFARTFGERVTIGLNGKYASEKIEEHTADALLFDAGAQLQASRILSLGAVVRNVGSKPKFRREEVKIPVIYGSGLSLRVAGYLLAAEVMFPRGDQTRIHLGGERVVENLLALRAGYKIGYDEESFTAGVGVTRSLWGVDYAFVPFGSGLGSTHRFALTVSFK